LEPNNGINAGLKLADFLVELELDEKADHYFQFVRNFFVNDSRGKKLGIDFEDEITGELTLNAGILDYQSDHGGKIGQTVRYPVTNDMDQTKEKLIKVLAEQNFSLENFTDSKPHVVEKEIGK
ncbi:hypothetical protein ACEF17_11815, partial [Streptococcus hyovaginalis]